MTQQSKNIQLTQFLRGYMHGYMTIETNIIYWSNLLTTKNMATPLALVICTSQEITKKIHASDDKMVEIDR